MMFTAKLADDFTIAFLRDKLKDLGLSTAGVKAKLFLRIMEADPTGAWMNNTINKTQGEVTGECVEYYNGTSH